MPDDTGDPRRQLMSDWTSKAPPPAAAKDATGGWFGIGSDRQQRLQQVADHKGWENGANPALDKTRNAEEKILKREQAQRPEPEMIRPSFAAQDGYATVESQRPQWDRQDAEAKAKAAAQRQTDRDTTRR